MPEPDPIVVVIDDDESFRRSTERLIRSSGFKVQSFRAATEFLKSRAPQCAGLRRARRADVGIERTRCAKGTGQNRHRDTNIIFITGHDDIPMSVQAMKAGAVEFLTKPFREQDLFDAIEVASSVTAPHARCARNWRTCARITIRSRRATEK